MKWILCGIVLFTIPLGLLYQNIVGSLAVSLPMTLIMIVAGFLFCSVSAYMAGLVGSSNNPVSGIAIATILFAAAVLLVLMGSKAPLGPVAAIMIGAVVCCAACVAGDNLQDLKAGHMIGATPWKQQVMLAVGSVVCALVMTPVLNLLASAYGIGVPSLAHPKPLLAPQATLMASVARGMFGGSLPWSMVITGGLIAIAIIVLDEILRIRVRLPGAGAGGRRGDLPADGCDHADFPRAAASPGWPNARCGAAPERRPRDEDIERMGRKGVLFAAGLITGEALMGIVIAVPIVLAGNPDVLALPAGLQFGQWLGVLVLVGAGLRTVPRRHGCGARVGSAAPLSGAGLRRPRSGRASR